MDTTARLQLSKISLITSVEEKGREWARNQATFSQLSRLMSLEECDIPLTFDYFARLFKEPGPDSPEVSGSVYDLIGYDYDEDTLDALSRAAARGALSVFIEACAA